MEAENEVELALNRTWRPQLAVTVRAKIQHVAFSKLHLKSRLRAVGSCGVSDFARSRQRTSAVLNIDTLDANPTDCAARPRGSRVEGGT